MSHLTASATNRLGNYEDCQEAINALFEDARMAQPETAFEQFLDFAVRFSGLSMYNAMLLRIQKPGASAVATARKWASVGRWPKPGAAPLVILQPFGPVRFVYALEDTEGEELEGAQANSLFAEGKVKVKTYDQIRDAANACGVRVTEQPSLGSLLAGFAQTSHHTFAQEVQSSADAPHRWNVVLNANLDLPSRFATLAHELGHIYCGHLGGHPKGMFPQRRTLSVEAKEVEAESVAWLVCLRNGVQARSVQYLVDYARQIDLTEISMFAIFDAANRVESRTSSDLLRRRRGGK